MSNPEYGIPERPVGVNKFPDNTNLGIPQNFHFALKRIPTLSYFVQSVALNEVSSDATDVDYALGPKVKLPSVTARITYFTLTFLVNEDVRNYYEIVKWMREATPYKDFSEVKPLKDISEEAVLVYLSNKKNPYKRVVMTGVFPTEISELEYDYTDTENKPIIATAKFTLNDYKVENL